MQCRYVGYSGTFSGNFVLQDSEDNVLVEVRCKAKEEGIFPSVRATQTRDASQVMYLMGLSL